MKNYQAPEVVEIGRANELIIGLKIGPLWETIDQDFTLPAGSVIDVD